MNKKNEIVIQKNTLVLISIIVLLSLTVVGLAGLYLGKQTITPDTVTTGTTIQQRASVSADDDPSLGDVNAPVTVIEFSDFQCPFCRASYRDVLPQFKNDYVASGKVKFVYRDFPLAQIHPAALPAAEAGECADEQGKFWDMHNKIFGEQDKKGQSTVAFNTTDLKNWAAEIGLDAQKFSSCLDSGKYKSEVAKDLSDGENAGVQGTPTFFVGNPKDGYSVIPGAVPYDVFKQVVDQELARAG
ncbi:MAG: DsbA family protein [Candidatus Aenigmarchaeota archaeon]|nr:DsbA family protein [Candidatus Aenigmarchaeota archaeon]